MKPLALLLALVALLIAVGLSGMVTCSQRHEDRAFTVDELTSRLDRDPGDWLGRTVLVRGVARPCQVSASPARFLLCHHRPQDHLDPGLSGSRESLALVSDSQSVWFTMVRRLPAVGRLLPAQQVLRWGAVATYRIRIRSSTGGLCGSALCDEAVLLDAAP
jgi:hypothetical protein